MLCPFWENFLSEGAFSFAKIRKNVLLIVKNLEGLTFPAVNRRGPYGSAENHR